MKNLVILFTFFFISSAPVIGQIIIVNTSLDTAMDIVYYNQSCIIQIKGLSNSKDIRVTTSTYGKDDPNFELRPDNYEFSYRHAPGKGRFDTISVYLKTKLIAQKVFKNIYLGNFTLRIGSTKDSLMTINSILANPTIITYIPNNHYTGVNDIRVVAFDLEIRNKSNRSLESFDKIEGNRLSSRQQSVLANLKPGDRLVIGATIRGGELCSRHIGPYVVIIK